MAEVNTDLYRSLGQNNDPLKQPLAIMQLLGAVNQNKLQNMEIGSRQGVSDAYANNPNPDLMTLGRAAGPNAPAVLNQAIQNQQLQNDLRMKQQDVVQRRIGALGATLGPKASVNDYEKGIVEAAKDNPTIPPDMWTQRLDAAHKIAKDPKALHQWAIAQGTTAPGFDALKGEAGPINEGQPTTINAAEAATRRAGAVPGQSGVGMETTAPAGYIEAAGRGAALLGDARSRAANYGSDVFPMTQLLSNLEKLGPQGTGPGTHEINTMKSFVQSNLNWLPGADKIIGDPNQIKNYNEAEKYATQLAGSRASQFGHGTDQAMAQSLIGSPNTHISNLAGVDLTKAIIGLRRMEHVQTLEADNDPSVAKNPAKYGTWAARWATNVDPRAFMVDLMDKDQLSNLQKSIKSPADKAKFNRSVKMAIENGIITNPAGDHAPGQQ